MIKKPLPKFYLYRRIVLSKLFIDEHFDENIDVLDMAGEAYFSKFHFIRLFKYAYGKTPHQYLIWVRIENAKLLLRTQATVAEVCYSVGFGSAGSFTQLFKRMTKLSPSAYQQTQRLRNIEIKEDPLKFIPGCFAQKMGLINNRNFQQSQDF